MPNKRSAEPSNTRSGSNRAASPATSRSETSSSSKASSPEEATNNQIDFPFLNFSHPSDAKASRTRRAVRSHVTRQQHQREQALQAARRPHGTDPQAMQGERVQTNPMSQAGASPETRQPTSSPEASSPSPSPATSPTHHPERRVNPSELYPRAWHPFIRRVMEHYRTNIVVEIPNLDISMTAGLLQARFFPFVMTDPAPLHAVVLMAASHYAKVHGPRSHAIDLLQLRLMAIREINSALEDTRRATSDQLITAVAQMAAYESLFGNRDIFHTHMTGLLRMVRLRGGLPALGLDGLLERILLWIDSNATHILGRPRYFDKAAFPTAAVHPRPNPRRFGG